MNAIKKNRQAFGYTQLDLVEQSGLSLRTIQRLEASEESPKGHSLRMLAAAFYLEPSSLQREFQIGDVSESVCNEDEISSLKFINLSVLAFIGIPFGNLIIPFIIWRKRRTTELVEKVGRDILNAQICWSLILAFSLCIAPFINSSYPLILVVLFCLMFLNVIWVFYVAYRIEENRFDAFELPMSLV